MAQRWYKDDYQEKHPKLVYSKVDTMADPRIIHMDKELFDFLVEHSPEGMRWELIDEVLYQMNTSGDDPRIIHIDRDLFDLLLENTPEGTHLELINGILYNMAPPSDDHEQMKVNLAYMLRKQLSPGGPCRIMMEQYAQEADATTLRPDITLTCYLKDWHKDHRPKTNRRINSPRLIVEILSPSTEDADRGEKFKQMRECETLEVYIMVGYRVPAIEVYRRANDWKLELFTSGQTIHLKGLGLKIDVDAVYDWVQF